MRSPNVLLHMVKHKIRLKYIIFAIVLIITLKVFGVFTLIFEKEYHDGFHYPLDGDVQEAVYQLRNGIEPSIAPINSYDYDYLKNVSDTCKPVNQQLRIVYLVKSDPIHFNRRAAIRITWGYQRRFSDVEIRTVFLLGYRPDANLQSMLDEESRKYSDILQANFTDSYYNNTIKTMMGLKWAVNFCPNSKFYLLVDDDYYVSTKNLLRFLRHPTNYPKYLQEPIYSLKHSVIKEKRQVMDFELPDDVRLYGGFVFQTKPIRNMFSRWYITLEEYPYNIWPAYVTAGAIIFSRESLFDMYYTSFFVKHFRFDDIYMSILALKSKIEPFHSNEFYYYRKEYSREGYTFTVASHGFSDPLGMITAWNEQKSLGNA